MINFPKIDYSKHPAFCNIPSFSKYDEDKLCVVYKDIETAFGALLNEAEKLYKLNDEIFDELKKKQWVEFNKILIEGSHNEKVKSLLKEVSQDAFDKCNEIIASKVKRSKYKKRNLSEKNFNALEKLRENSFSNYRIPEANMEKFKAYADQILNELRSKYDGSITWRGANPLSVYEGLGNVMRKSFEKDGIADIFSEYKQQDMVLYYLSVDYSHERQNWWRGCYKDIGLCDSSTNYMHFDNDPEVCKMMINLTDVGPESGPTGIVTGSNNWQAPFFQNQLFFALDRYSSKNIFPITPDNYYRPLYKSHRQLFMNLPELFRGSSHFGDDLLDGSETSEHLLNNEVKLIADAGNGILFDGNRGIHRGSTVHSGERLAAQVAFIDKTKVARLRGFRSRLKSLFKVSR